MCGSCHLTESLLTEKSPFPFIPNSKNRSWEWRSGARPLLCSTRSPKHSLPSTSTAIPFIFTLHYSCSHNSLFANYHPTSNKSIVYKLLYRPSSVTMCQDYLRAHKFLVRDSQSTHHLPHFTHERAKAQSIPLG